MIAHIIALKLLFTALCEIMVLQVHLRCRVKRAPRTGFTKWANTFMQWQIKRLPVLVFTASSFGQIKGPVYFARGDEGIENIAIAPLWITRPQLVWIVAPNRRSIHFAVAGALVSTQRLVKKGKFGKRPTSNNNEEKCSHRDEVRSGLFTRGRYHESIIAQSGTVIVY